VGGQGESEEEKTGMEEVQREGRRERDREGRKGGRQSRGYARRANASDYD
jgi:hypothetical protein